MCSSWIATLSAANLKKALQRSGTQWGFLPAGRAGCHQHLTCSAYWGRVQDRQRQGRAGAGMAGVPELVPLAPTAGVCSPGWSPITRLLIEGYLATFNWFVRIDGLETSCHVPTQCVASGWSGCWSVGAYASGALTYSSSMRAAPAW